MVECSYASDSTATGFQMIVHQNDLNNMHRLHANKTTDRQTPASVAVEENGLYLVTIFAIRGERGMVDSGVEYNMHLVMVDDITTTTTTIIIPTAATTTTIIVPIAATIAGRLYS